MMATYKMKSTQKGVKAGEVHPVTFREGSTYEIDDELAGQFRTLDAVEESSEEPVEPEATREDLHENWLDTDPAVLRHGELTAAQVIAKDESPLSDGQEAAAQVEGKAEGDEPATGEEAATDGSEDGTTRGRKSK